MGIKSEKLKATNEQVRLARLTLEGNSVDDEASKLQKLIKKVIETTSCTQAQAEIALYDNDNNLLAAIDHILESDKLDSWTETKVAKKEKKHDEERNFHYNNNSNTRTFVQRGRGSGFSDRGTRGRSNGAPRENYRDKEQSKESNGAPKTGRGGFDRPSTFSGRGGRGGGRGGYSRAVAPESSVPSFQEEKPQTKVDASLTESQKPVEESASTTVPTSTAPAAISFAAVAAAAHRKQELLKQQLQNPQATVSKRRSVSPVPPPAPLEEEFPSFDEPASSNQDEKVEESFYQSEQSVLPDEPLATASTHVEETVQESPSQAKVWTKQLKSELGIGIGGEPDVVAQTSPIPSNVSIHSAQEPAFSGVEFVGVETTAVNDYSFGFIDTPAAPIVPPAETSVASISTNNSDNIFNNSRISIPQKPVEPERQPLQNGNDFGLKSASPPSAYSQPNRTLSYDTSSVSYTPNDRGLVSNKSQFNQQVAPQPQQQQQQQQQQSQQTAAPQQSSQQQAPQPPQQNQPHHQQHPLIFPPQMPYNPYSYMNMYDQATREATLMQYGMGVDLASLSTFLPQSAPISQTAPAQALQSGQPRGDSHGLMDFNKFGSQGTREQQQQQQQPSNVGPPPGFQNASYIPQPNLSALFMQQPYAAPHNFGFMNMIPSVGSNGGGRQMYGQDDERKSYEKLASKPTTQPNQHSQYQHNGGNLGMYGGNKNNKTYNWGNN